MGFITKLDYSNNRQINQKQQTTTDLLGRTNFGLPFSGLTSGADYTTSALTNSFINVVSTFSGNNTTTNFNFGNGLMNGNEIYLNTITPLNSNTPQTVNLYFKGNLPNINPYFGNTVYGNYTGCTFDLNITNFSTISPGIYTGTTITNELEIYRADSSDYSGDGIWVNVNGKLKTSKLIVDYGSNSGSILTAINNSGDTQWQIPLFLSGNGINSIVSNSTPTNQVNGDNSFSHGNGNIVNGANSYALGENISIYGISNFITGLNQIINGNQNVTFGDSVNIIGILNLVYGTGGGVTGDNNFIFGDSHIINGDDNLVFRRKSNTVNGINNVVFGGSNILNSTNCGLINSNTNILDSNIQNSVIIGLNNKTFSVSDTVYVPYLNINSLYSGASVSDIGINAQGFVVNVLSDKRLKENIEPIENALEKINKLQGVSYNWKDRLNGGNSKRIGLIAQDVMEVIPELTFKNDTDYYGVHYGNITALLIEAVKELNKEKNTVKQIPKNSNDTLGEIGDIVSDDNFLYVKTENSWKRTNLSEF